MGSAFDAPNVHPPGVMLILAAVWKIFGFSIVGSRLTMLAIAAVGVYLSFLLAIRLSRKSPDAPAFAAVLFLMTAPLFYTQSHDGPARHARHDADGSGASCCFSTNVTPPARSPPRLGPGEGDCHQHSYGSRGLAVVSRPSPQGRRCIFWRPQRLWACGWQGCTT